MPMTGRVVTCLSFFLLFVSPTVYGEDSTSLEANFKAEITALNSRDLDATLAQVHEGIVLFGIFSPFPSNGKEEFRQAVESYFGSYEEATFTPVSPQFRLVGTTAVAWGHYQLAGKPKGGQLTYSHGRYIFTHAQVDGKWLILSMHISPLEPYRYTP